MTQVTHSLDAVLDLRAAAELKQCLLGLLAQGKPLAIDASQVKRVSTACVQVIAAFAIAARQAGLTVAIGSRSPAFAAAFANLGLDGIIAGELL